MSDRRLPGALLAGLLAAAMPARAAFITNGSFESGPAMPGFPGFVALANGATSITGWTVVAGNIDYGINGAGFWAASNGSRSIDLDGNVNGAIEQLVATEIGTTYEILFDMAGNFYGGPAVKSLRVSAGGQSSDYTFNASGRSANAMGWTTRSFVFTAASATTALRFAATDVNGSPGCAHYYLGAGTACFGAALDNVRIETVGGSPSPSPVSVPGTVALAGWALLLLRRWPGAARRRCGRRLPTSGVSASQPT